MINVFSFHPEYFNNNGDQGNLEALSHFTRCDLNPESIDKADFVLFGDASRAAMRHFDAELDSLMPALQRRIDAGEPTLLVGSCFEFFSEGLHGLPRPVHGERVSEFRSATSDGITAKGYRNSTIVSGDLFIKGSFIGTTLFGPVLAKNIALLERVANSMNLQIEISQAEREWIEKI